VRVVQMYGADLSLFQFHGQLTWACFFLNADRTIYGRYGSRGVRKGMRENDKDVSLEGFRRACEGALELHKGHPGNKAALAGKTGPPPYAKTPEATPAAQARDIKPAHLNQGKNCLHCHQVQDFELMSLRKAGQAIPDRLLWAYPMPDVLGLQLDARERATVSAVAPGSAAARAGFQAGDRIAAMDGQPPISVADVQWVLHQAKEPGSVRVEVDRGGKKAELALALEEGWRRKFSFVETASVGWVTRQTVAGMRVEVLPAPDRAKQGIAEGALALRILDLTPDFVKDRNASPKRAGLAKGDVIVEVDGKGAPLAEQDFLLLLLSKKGGSKVELTYVRNGASQKATVEFP
jgi:hypothetical protein